MILDICEQFQIPSSCKIDKKLYKKHFLENFSLKNDEKKAIKEDVESITLVYLLNSKNINIKAYINDEVDYSEVAYIHLELLDDKHYKKLSHIIQNIPYMLVLVLSYHDSFCINISTKRINQNDSTKLVVQEEYFTPWIDSSDVSDKEKVFLQTLKIQNQSFSNFKLFYHDTLDKLIAFNLSKDSQILISPRATHKESLAIITVVEEQIHQLQNKIKKETHFSDKVDLNIALKELHDRLSEVKEGL